MSIFNGLKGLAQGFFRSPALSVAATAVSPALGGVVAGGSRILQMARAAAPTAIRALPGAGVAVAAGAAGTMIGNRLSRGHAMGAPRRRRGRGFSARDIRQTRRMLRLIKEMQHACPHPRVSRAPSRCK